MAHVIFSLFKYNVHKRQTLYSYCLVLLFENERTNLKVTEWIAGLPYFIIQFIQMKSQGFGAT